jgi:hypothetical protein
MKNATFWDVTAFGSCKVLTRAARRHMPKDGILHIHRREKPQTLHERIEVTEKWNVSITKNSIF